MRRRTFKDTLYRWSDRWIVGCVTIISILSIFISLDLSKSTGNQSNAWLLKHFSWFVDLSHSWGWIIILIILPTMVFAAILKKWADVPILWHAIETVLDELTRHSFIEECINDHRYYNRATLFKFKQYKFWIWPWRGKTPWGPGVWPNSGWLVPVARSGNTGQNTTTVFLSPDNADRSEGVAGLTRSIEQIVAVDGLPDLNSNPSNQDISVYAARSAMSEDVVRERIRREKSLPRSLCGIPIFVHSRLWGVIILDSRRPDGIKDGTINFTSYAITQQLLGKLLEKV